VIKVLFVCAGNICRSPMAEAVFADMVAKAGLSDKISVDSAGTGSWHVGDYADARTLALLKRQKIAYDGRARQLRASDFDQFDYIITMDVDNFHNVSRAAQGIKTRAEIKPLLSYAIAAGTVQTEEVPDPYYNNKFEIVYDLVKAGGAALLEHIRQKHHL
jgi:protein-tyrosine phosphatase